MTSSEHPVQRKYDRAAGVYDRRWGSYVQATLDYLAESISLRGDAAVLDVACGTGELIVRLVEHHPDLSITGIDVSEEMLSEARQKLSAHASVTLRRGRAEDLPFATDSFDIVVSASAYHYFDPPERALVEFRRVLRPGGRLVIMDWDRTHPLWGLLDPVFRWIDPAYVRCYRPQTIAAMLRDEGFQGVAVEKIRLGWRWGLWTAHATAPDENTQDNG